MAATERPGAAVSPTGPSSPASTVGSISPNQSPTPHFHIPQWGPKTEPNASPRASPRVPQNMASTRSPTPQRAPASPPFASPRSPPTTTQRTPPTATQRTPPIAVQQRAPPVAVQRPSRLAQQETPDSPASPVEDGNARRVEEREAMQYWGYLVKPDKCGTERLDRLLAGIAVYVADHFEPKGDCKDLTPRQLAAFYRAVGGNYDILFVDTSDSSLSHIYTTLGCLHSMQPANATDTHCTPTVPALKAKGFVTWQTIQLLLGPEEHVPFLQSAVKQFDIVDPETGEKFPKVLPKEAFPTEPNKEMLAWYDEVSQKLKMSCESCVPSRVPARPDLSVSETSATESEDERATANYFANPMYRDRTGRPTVVRRFSRGKQALEDRGRGLMNSVRHLWNPVYAPQGSGRGHGRRRSYPDRDHEDDDYEDVTPTSLHSAYRGKPPSRPRIRSPEPLVETESDSDDGVKVTKRPAVPRRGSSNQSRDSQRRERVREREREWERESPPSSGNNHHAHHHVSPPLRHRRSHSPAPTPRDYFPPQPEDGSRRHTHHTHYANSEPGPGAFAPSKGPLFAERVAKMNSSRRGEESPRRVPDDGRPSAYSGRPAGRYPRRSVEPVDERPRYSTSPSRYPAPRRNDRDYDGRDARESRDREYRDPYRGREFERERERRSVSYEPDLERERRRNGGGYVEGANGRRYPSEAPWR